jgi:hypothetical protein
VRANLANTVSLAAIVVVSALFGTFVWWRAPGIDQYMRDWMIQARFRRRTTSLSLPLTNRALPASADSLGRALCRRVLSTL